MERTYIYKTLLLLMAIFTVVGCDDNKFLEEDPETFYTIDNVFSTSEQVDQVLVGCYSHVRVMMCMTEESNTAFVFRGGNGTDMFDVATIRRSNRFNDYSILNSTTEVFYINYSHWYQLISKANLALYAAELPQISWTSEAEKLYVMAQARFFRAFAYRNLGELYGGVPLVTEITTTPRYDFKRSSRLETYQYAIDELEAILNDLPETTGTMGRLVRGAAQHNLCQLYIDKGIALEEGGKGGEAPAAYQKAIAYGNDVIDGSVYSLMTERFGSRADEDPVYYYATEESMQTPEHLYSAAGYPVEGNLYWDLFQEGNQNYQEGNKEAIWVAQIDYDAYKAEDGESKLQYSRSFGPVYRDPMSAHLNSAMEDVGGRGIVQVTPTKYTRDLVYEGKWGEDIRNSEAVLRRVFLGNIKTSEYYGKQIPWDVLYKKDQNGKYDDGAYTLIYPISCKIGPDFYTLAADGRVLRSIFRDDYLIRLPETILLRAEAKLRVGDKSGAASDINMLRSRAKCSYLVTANDVSLDLILDERTRELMYEESRWNTLLRMGGTVAADRIKKYSYWDYPRLTLTKPFNLWPIPQTVIDTNKDVVLEQNPGW